MNQFPSVSIITPSYNQADYLDQAIQSVLSQNYSDIEYIVIDGGSTDGSVEIIKKYSNKLTYWESSRDSGQAEAINKGLYRATGKYVAWLNSDDLYLPGCIEKVVNVFEANLQAGMIFGQVDVINKIGKRIGKFRPINNFRFENLLILNTIIPQQGAFFRRDVLESVGYINPDFHLALDHELFLRIGDRWPVVSFPDVVAQYRLSDFNKGTVQRSNWGDEFIKILDNFYRDEQFNNKYKHLYSMAYAGAYYLAACNYLDDENYKCSRKYIIKSLRINKEYLYKLRWWINYLRTFFGKTGNQSYGNLKLWLARKKLLRDIEYDWWTALKLHDD